MADLAIPAAVPDDDVQARRPTTHISLTRVGVTGVEKVIRIGVDGSEQMFFAELECFVDLGPEQKGAHMSRFEEVVNEAIDQVVLGEVFKAETLAQHIAERVRDRQDALRAEVRIAARYPEQVNAPASGSPTQEIYTLFGSAVASERGTRRLIGVEAQGMTACPCAQEMVTARSRERLVAEGFTDDEIERVLRSVPVATHNQRGIGRLYIGCVEGCTNEIEARTLLRIVERSMSSEIYELMKRSDEVEVVERAHMHPRFVEDCVREMARMAVEEFGAFDDETFLLARQENLETIHRHNVVAERHGLIGELRRELTDEIHVPHHVTMREWLEDRPLRG
ncbi:MAG TPA: GTP cyclohydrolase MptA [Thermoleophilaceae bacterium]|nr:GTP cyclohydrolase MptA [Thermoleophilaceae bacterium]